MDPMRVLTLAPEAQAPDFDTGSVQFVGTATVLIRYAGFTVLTDPNFLHQGDHVHLGYGLRARRLTQPALELEALPPIDLVVLSHLHEDHFDRLVAERLDRKVPIATTEEAARALARQGFRSTYPLPTWEGLELRKGPARLRLTALPGRHGPPGLAQLVMPSVMGSMLEFGTETLPVVYRIYISGDTLAYRELEAIPRRYPRIDLALLHLGGTRILGVLVTMDARQGMKAMRIIAPEEVIPIHYNDYTVFKSPIEDFLEAMQAAGLQQRLRFLRPGESHRFHPVGFRRRDPARRRRAGL